MTVPARTPVLEVLVDTNVILDLVLARDPWGTDAANLFAAIERGALTGWAASHAITTVHYIVARHAGGMAATTAVGDLLRLLDVVPLDAADFQRALALGLADYEDAVQAAACLRVGAAYLVTRDARHFKGAPVATSTPGALLALLGAHQRP
jgi:predicted nucleic acid-binding protein